MKYISVKLFIQVVVLALIILELNSCNNIKAPAPNGLHGEFAFENAPTYTLNEITKDTFLKIINKKNLIVKNGRLNSYDAPWDSLRYLINNIFCDIEKIEAYIEFKDKKAISTTLQVLWFNSSPTKNNEEYETRTKKYYECFEVFLKENNLIK